MSTEQRIIILVCENCGGKNIQQRAWVDANTNEFRGDSGDHDDGDRWCDDCEDHVDFIPESEYRPNKMAAMFNMDIVKKQIAECPVDEIVILCPHWSINKPKYDESEQAQEAEQGDWDELEEILDTTIVVNDYDGLVADPHGIMND